MKGKRHVNGNYTLFDQISTFLGVFQKFILCENSETISLQNKREEKLLKVIQR